MSNSRSPITTHILDTSRGRPADGVAVRLFRVEGTSAEEIANGTTDTDGRIAHWMGDQKLEEGDYQITFEIESYFKLQGMRPFYPRADVYFHVHNIDEHYHVPLLLNPFGYSTYRGS